MTQTSIAISAASRAGGCAACVPSVAVVVAVAAVGGASPAARRRRRRRRRARGRGARRPGGRRPRRPAAAGSRSARLVDAEVAHHLLELGSPRPPGRAGAVTLRRRSRSLGCDVDRAALRRPSRTAGTAPSVSRMRAWRARKPGSRSFQCGSTGVAMKIDEYVPDAMPIEQREREVLQRLAAEEHQREHRQQRAEARRQRARR